ncbi:MAG: 4a-hydroxytetrahydrobiopterin dehydratase [Gammaproteobacteria bacterium]|nr:4a-hydroxytetrahydrobiopterin dehydratase [Gammaproteobacteria bacterium]
MSELTAKRCKPCEGGVAPLDRNAAEKMRDQIHEDWQLSDDATAIIRRFRFANYYQTMAFVNAVAWIAHQDDHHPDLMVAYSRCEVTYSTHAIGGLSENDFICAAKVDALLC